MSLFGNFMPSITKVPTAFVNFQVLRMASKKGGGSTKYGTNRRGRAHHYGWKVQDGHLVTAGSILVKQRTLRFHPGENVKVCATGNLMALEAGTVAVTCQPFTADLSRHVWLRREYSQRAVGRTIYKKYYSVLTPPQVGRFRLVDEV